jgi:hypothetical protein
LRDALYVSRYLASTNKVISNFSENTDVTTTTVGVTEEKAPARVGRGRQIRRTEGENRGKPEELRMTEIVGLLHNSRALAGRSRIGLNELWHGGGKAPCSQRV